MPRRVYLSQSFLFSLCLPGLRLSISVSCWFREVCTSSRNRFRIYIMYDLLHSPFKFDCWSTISPFGALEWVCHSLLPHSANVNMVCFTWQTDILYQGICLILHSALYARNTSQTILSIFLHAIKISGSSLQPWIDEYFICLVCWVLPCSANQVDWRGGGGGTVSPDVTVHSKKKVLQSTFFGASGCHK